MKIQVLSVGRLRPPFAELLGHYSQLLGHYVTLDLIEVKEEQQLLGRIPQRSYLCQLDADGKTYSSEQFSGFLEQRRQSGIDLGFIIGGAKGSSFKGADHKLSLGPATLPHQLARIVLLEQLYRAHKILLNEPYHY